MDFEEAADELYAGSPDEFTAARNAAAKQARSQGDRELAARITALRKPTLPAWVVNQMARRRRGDIESLLDLGRTLRESSTGLSGDELRQLTRQRHQLVQALVQQARDLAGDDGRRLSEDAVQGVRQTFEATLSDADSADAVAAGRLSDALQVSGFGFAGFPDPAGPAPGGTSRRPAAARSEAPLGNLDAKRQQHVQQQELAESGLTRAEEVAQSARDRHENAQAHLRDAQGARERARSQVDRLRMELDSALEELARATAEERAAKREQAKAERKAKDATARLKSAASRSKPRGT
jgi:hypothetical protein